MTFRDFLLRPRESNVKLHSLAQQPDAPTDDGDFQAYLLRSMPGREAEIKDAWLRHREALMRKTRPGHGPFLFAELTAEPPKKAKPQR